MYAYPWDHKGFCLRGPEWYSGRLCGLHEGETCLAKWSGWARSCWSGPESWERRVQNQRSNLGLAEACVGSGRPEKRQRNLQTGTHRQGGISAGGVPAKKLDE